MSDLWHAAVGWLFFDDIPMSPFAIFGAGCLGWLLRGWRDKRATSPAADRSTDPSAGSERA